MREKVLHVIRGIIPHYTKPHHTHTNARIRTLNIKRTTCGRTSDRFSQSRGKHAVDLPWCNKFGCASERVQHLRMITKEIKKGYSMWCDVLYPAAVPAYTHRTETNKHTFTYTHACAFKYLHIQTYIHHRHIYLR